MKVLLSYLLNNILTKMKKYIKLKIRYIIMSMNKEQTIVNIEEYIKLLISKFTENQVLELNKLSNKKLECLDIIRAKK